MNPPSQDRALPRLVVDSPDEVRGQVYELDHEPLLVGRGTACQIQLLNPRLSRRHAQVSRTDGHTTVEDLSSTNGTRVNGRRVLRKQQLHSGDVLDFGPLEVHYEEPLVEAPTQPHADTPAPEAATVVRDNPVSPRPGDRATRPKAGAQGAAPEDAAAREAAAQAATAPQETARKEHAGQSTGRQRTDGKSDGTAGRQDAGEQQAGRQDGPRPAGPRVETPPRGSPVQTAPPKPTAPPRFGPGPGPGANAGPASASAKPAPGTPTPGRATPGRAGAGTPSAPRPGTPHQKPEQKPEQAAARFDVGEQRDGHFNNIGRDQYNRNEYNNWVVQDNHIQAARRADFFHKLSAIRTTARHTAMVGLLLAVLGGAFLGFADSSQNAFDEDKRFGGFTLDSLGTAVVIVGSVLLVIGVALVIWTVVRKRRYEKEEDRRLNPGSSPST
ncbi:FHA domain-containing protein [Kitasatospora sp. NPDC047058]|uniref:FHA domain-containing protein n=1 Tax=Kitasatospora sp. NPDC047058 TaxID=3155620 RepID=UPI0033C895DD